MSLQEVNSAELKSRIFSDKSKAVKQSIESNQNIRVRHPKEIFQHDAFPQKIPQKSVYSTEKGTLITKKKQKKENSFSSWITVIGVIPEKNQELIEYFSKFGNIEQFEEGPGNWCYILYPNQEIANIPLFKAKSGPLIINPSFVVSVAEGRLRPRYMTIKTEPSKEEKQQRISDEYSIEKKTKLSAILSSIFGE